jgi:hypothetical protein
MSKYHHTPDILSRMNTLFDTPATFINSGCKAHNDDVYDNEDDDISEWTPLVFKRHKGKTLPEVVCYNTAWFLWAIRENIFEQHADEAATLYRRIQGIKIPRRRPANWVVEYRYDCDDRFVEFDIVRRTDEPYLKYNCQSKALDLTLIRVRHRREWPNFIRDFREHFFGGKNLTKERCEQFFSDRSRFVKP